MYFECRVESLLLLLQRVAGAVERKQSNPLLSHIYLEVHHDFLRAIGTDIELELAASSEDISNIRPGKIAMPARKFLDICRALDKNNTMSFECEDGAKVKIKSGNSRYNLSGLSADDFPIMKTEPDEIEFNIDSALLASLMSSTLFAVAQNDVRYFLNGSLIKVLDNLLMVVGTDGHRLAHAKGSLEQVLIERSVILPRKASVEILRLLSDMNEKVTIGMSLNHFKLCASKFTLTSRLVEGKYPDFRRLIPLRGENNFVIDRDLLKESLSRVAVLTNEKFRGVRFQLRDGGLNLLVLSPEQETAEERLDIDYTGSSFDIGFNASYLLDVLNHVPPGDVQFFLSDSTSSVIIISDGLPEAEFIVMPMRL